MDSQIYIVLEEGQNRAVASFPGLNKKQSDIWQFFNWGQES